MPKIAIIDGYGIVFRTYHINPELKNISGKPIGAIYGFVNIMRRLIQNLTKNRGIDKILVALDCGKKTFRHNIYDKYKANRPSAPEDLKLQFPLIRDAIKALGLVFEEHERLEADDIIAHYSNSANQQGYEVEIISIDKDLTQLINDSTIMFDFSKNKVIDKDAVYEKFNVYPNQIADYLSIIGDSSDNVPGVKSIGAKGAAQLLNQYKNLDDIYSNIDQIQPERQRKLLSESKDNAFLSYKLISLNPNFNGSSKYCDDLNNDLDRFNFYDINYDNLAKFCHDMGFANSSKTNSPPSISVNKINIDNLQNLKTYAKSMMSYSYQSIVLNDTSIHINYGNNEIIMDLKNTQNIIKDIITEIGLIFSNPSIRKVFYNFETTIQLLRNLGYKNEFKSVHDNKILLDFDGYDEDDRLPSALNHYGVDCKNSEFAYCNYNLNCILMRNIIKKSLYYQYYRKCISYL